MTVELKCLPSPLCERLSIPSLDIFDKNEMQILCILSGSWSRMSSLQLSSIMGLEKQLLVLKTVNKNNKGTRIDTFIL